MTDHWKAYAEFLPENIHTQSKAETYTVEGYNSILRHFLARLRRKRLNILLNGTTAGYMLLIKGEVTKRNIIFNILKY